MPLTSSVMGQSISNFRLYCCSKKIQMLRKKVELLLEQLQVFIFVEIVFGVRCTLKLTSPFLFSCPMPHWGQNRLMMMMIPVQRFNNGCRGLQAGSPSSRARERQRSKRSGGKESCGGAPRKVFVSPLRHSIILQLLVAHLCSNVSLLGSAVNVPLISHFTTDLLHE